MEQLSPVNVRIAHPRIAQCPLTFRGMMLLRRRRESSGAGEELMDLGQNRNTLPGDPSDSDPGYEVTSTSTLSDQCRRRAICMKLWVKTACRTANIIGLSTSLFLSVQILLDTYFGITLCGRLPTAGKLQMTQSLCSVWKRCRVKEWVILVKAKISQIDSHLWPSEFSATRTNLVNRFGTESTRSPDRLKISGM